MLTMLSALSTTRVNSSETAYLKYNDNYYGVADIYLESNYNIRMKKNKITQDTINICAKEVVNMSKLRVLN